MTGGSVIDEQPLTPVQQGMLFHHLEATNAGVDIEQFVGELHEDVDAAGMELAWQRIADRHPVMRTRFAWIGRDEPVQQVVDAVAVELAVHDWRDRDDDTQTTDFDRFLADDRRRGFELDQAPMWRIALFRLGPARERFVFTYHHSLLDTSVVWVTEEAFRTYDAARRGEVAELDERRPYREHLMWLREHLAADRADAQAYYASLLDGVDGPTSISALERPAADADAFGYGALRFGIDPDVSHAIHALAETHQINPPVVVEAAWALVLSAFSGSNDVVFGSTRGCRRTSVEGADAMVGLFINTPPVRVRLDPHATVLELLTDVRRQQVDKRRHEHTALTDIHAAVGIRQGSLFDTITVVNELHQGTRLKQAGPEFAGRDFDLHDQTNFPLTLLAYTDPQIHFKLSYDLRRFDDAAMARARDLFVAVLAAIAADPGAPIAALPRVPPGDTAQLARWNATERAFPSRACLHHLFEAQVDRTPDDLALVFRTERLTYRELDERANAVAAELRRLGVGPDSMVGVHVERSVEMVVGLLAILKAGGAYVPMDPTYPATRIAMMLEDSHADVVLTHSSLRGSLASVPHVIELDRVTARSAVRPTVDDQTSDDLAYVIFTSGSTGRPKGVMVEHRNVANFLTAMDEVLGYDATAPRGVWLAVTSISFDISVLELFWTLTRGFVLVVQHDEGRLVTEAPAGAAATTAPAMDFSLFYFAADAGAAEGNRYRLLMEGARFADIHGFTAVWTPERHFHEFGGLYPNAAITSAAVAVVTERIQIRAGSVVLPLHNVIRCAEDWSVVDNLSGGRVGLSFASGWHANDFVLAPGNFERRRELMAEGIDTIRSLWRGESITATAGDGRSVEVRMFPPPVQPAPQIWITAGGSPATFELAGRIGASILTNLLVMGTDDLVANIARYRAAYRAAGHEGNGHVSLMLHTYVTDDEQLARERVREPFLHYLRTSTDLINQVQWDQTSFAKPGASRTADETVPDLDDLTAEELAVIMDHAFERYVHSAGLFGTPDTCLATIRRLHDLGVDEIACLIDFGLPEHDVLDGLRHLDELRRRCVETAPAESLAGRSDGDREAADDGLVAQIARHGVTHLQCTPSMAAVVAASAEGMAALATLDVLLLGGEALPAPLVDRLRPQLRGELLNMYGPTETTIWSTVAPIRHAGQPITIGRPIANTEIHVVDPDLRPQPIGVPGELLIGGAGVVRGYLDRAELTAERFVHLPEAGGARVYRTGDLARLRADGELEFLGRLDHQVKIRGYRIELGEIETTIGRHPGVAETVVVARPDAAGDAQLVAYVVAGAASDTSAADAWGALWDDAYDRSDRDDATFDVAGWNDSYTGAPIPDGEMREWVDATVARIRELHPRRVLEVGCGTGLLLFRIAPHCDRYLGVDPARRGLERIERRLAAAPIPGVSVRVGLAHDLRAVVDERFDVVVVNSVAQYFPDIEYLLDVVRAAMAVLEPGGSLYLGDLRSLPLLPAFAASVELARAADDAPIDELRDRATRRAAGDAELVVDPALFEAIGAIVPEIGDARVRLKHGEADNELTRFRYDVVLTKSGGTSRPRVEVRHVALGERPLSAIGDELAGEPELLLVTAIPNARVVGDVQLARWLAGEPGAPSTAAGVRHALEATSAGVHPGDLAGVDTRYDVDAMWSAAGPDRFDALFRRHDALVRPRHAVVEPRPLASYANKAASGVAANLGPELRAHLRATLPDYMVPTAFVMLDALPRTPNGKIDRNALPEPDRGRIEQVAATVAPESDLERRVAAVWQDILSLDVVGVETNLFDLGANSLMMVRASTRLGEALGRKVSLVEMFGYPTIRSLAAHLGSDGPTTNVKQGTDRAQARREALQRRRRP